MVVSEVGLEVDVLGEQAGAHFALELFMHRTGLQRACALDGRG